MTSGDMKIELNEEKISNTVPITYPSPNYSETNPNVYDRNVGEIDFEDPNLIYDPDNTYDLDNEEEYDSPKRFR